LINRCPWVPLNDPLYLDYHDREWGVPVHDDRLLFEFLLLEGFQAGLSWRTVLNKRDNFRQAFDYFNPEKIALFDQKKIEQLLSNPGIIRNRSKINASITNSIAFLKVQEEYGSFDRYIWDFIDRKPVVNEIQRIEDYPSRTQLSDKISKDLTQRGFKFVGSTIIYAHMQATGMVNDHSVDCYRYDEINALGD